MALRTSRASAPWKAGSRGRSSTTRCARLRELGRQSLLLHLAGERLVVVVHGDELDGKIRTGGQQRVPDVARAVVFRAADDADVDGMRAIGERAVPLDPGVGAEKDIRLALPQQALEQTRGRRRLPEG